MAEGLLETPIAHAVVAAAAAEGLDLAAALRGDVDALRPTEVAQPALLLVSLVLGEAVASAPEVSVVAVAGHSVGEYAALVASGALDAAAAMRLVVARGRAMAAMREGTMAALVGADASLAEEVCAAAEAEGLGPVVVANHNAPGQVVVSGTVEGVRRACELSRARGARRTIPLSVSGAFHSPLMSAAAASLGALLDAAQLADPRVPVVCNVDGAAVADAEGLRSRLRRQLVSPVRWTDCIRTLAGLGPDVLVEAGPGSVLTGLARRITPDVRAISVNNLREAGAVGSAEGVAANG